MDITQAIAPKSDQLNADDLLTGPRTFNITEARPGSSEQPVELILAELPGRPYRPSKTMLRVLAVCWESTDTDTYAGRSLTLYRDPDVMFGGAKVGGIKISHLSHIDERMTFDLTSTRGKKAPHTVEPQPTAADVASCTDPAKLRAMWATSSAERRAQITARVAELRPATTPNEVPL